MKSCGRGLSRKVAAYSRRSASQNSDFRSRKCHGASGAGKKTAGNQPLPESGRVKIPFAFPLVFPQLNVAMHRAQKGFSVPFIGLIAAINRSELESNRGN
jgi:hypothetical protein